MVHAVFRKAASRPRRLCTTLWRSPTSEKSARPYMTIVAIAMTPNISGTSNRVITKLATKRTAWLRAKPATVQPPARSTRARRPPAGREILARNDKAGVAIWLRLTGARQRGRARIALCEAGDRPIHHRNEHDAARGGDDHQDAEQGAEKRPAERVGFAVPVSGPAHGGEELDQHHEEKAAEEREADQAARQRDEEIAVDDVDDALALDELLHHRQLHEVPGPEERILEHHAEGNLEQPLSVCDVLRVDRADEGQVVDEPLSAGQDQE